MSVQTPQENTSKTATSKTDLDALYKPVGIQAITAASLCKGQAAGRNSKTR